MRSLCWSAYRSGGRACFEPARRGLPALNAVPRRSRQDALPGSARRGRPLAADRHEPRGRRAHGGLRRDELKHGGIIGVNPRGRPLEGVRHPGPRVVESVCAWGNRQVMVGNIRAWSARRHWHWLNTRLLTDSTGQFLGADLFGAAAQNAGAANLLGQSLWDVPVALTTTVGLGAAIVGGFANAAAIARRGGPTVEASNSQPGLLREGPGFDQSKAARSPAVLPAGGIHVGQRIELISRLPLPPRWSHGAVSRLSFCSPQGRPTQTGTGAT